MICHSMSFRPRVVNKRDLIGTPGLQEERYCSRLVVA